MTCNMSLSMNELEPPLSRVWHQEGCSLGRSEVIKALMKKTESKRARCWPCLRELEPVWGSQGRRPSVSRYGTQSRRIGRKPFQPGSGVCICGNHAPSTAIQGPGASYLGLTSLEMSVKLNLRHWVCPDHLSWITLTKINQASSHMSGDKELISWYNWRRCCFIHSFIPAHFLVTFLCRALRITAVNNLSNPCSACSPPFSADQSTAPHLLDQRHWTLSHGLQI